MPTPPAESIGGRLVSQLKSDIKDNRKCLDLLMASVIFIAAAIEFVSWLLSFGPQATITNKGNNYLIYWQPLLSSIVIWTFSLFFFIKVIRYRSCVYTKFVARIYFFIQSFNCIAYIMQFGIKFYNVIIYPIFLFSILVLLILKSAKWLLQKHS